MSEPPPPSTAEDAPVGSAQALTSESIEAILADFRSWLHALPAGTTPPPQEVGPDLHTLLGQFVALRHEVNLQTRASRTQIEQNSALLQQLTDALAALRQAQAAERDTSDASIEEAERPLIKALVDLHDALSLASREVQRVKETLDPLREQMSAVTESKDALETPPRRSFWQRLFGGSEHEEIARLRAMLGTERAQHQEWVNRSRTVAERVRQTLHSLVTGYGMSVQRVERALSQHGLEAIPTVGEAFDPELMEVLEVVHDSGRESGEVVEEVRRGYLWNRRLFRYAQVRVAKS